MALCVGSNGCGCALQSASLAVSGSGTPGDPWLIEGASPQKMTAASRLALSGGSLFEGLQVWETDTNSLWSYDVGAGKWHPMYGRYGATGSLSGTATAPTLALSSAINFDNAEYDPYAFGLPGSTMTVPSGGDGLYVIGVRMGASANWALDSHVVIELSGAVRRAGAEGFIGTALPVYTGLHDLTAGSTVAVKVYNAGGSDRTVNLARVHLVRIARYP